MKQEEVLLAGVLENPDEDLPRLIYADWLEEQGEPRRAAFIRDSVAGSTSEAEGLEWLRSLGLDLDGVSVTFRRGFVEEVHFLDAESFLRNGESWFRLNPIRCLTLEGNMSLEGMKRLASCPLLSRLSALSLGDMQHVPREGWRALFCSPHFANLTTLSLHNCILDEEHVSVLASSPHLAGLRRLDLGYNAIGVGGARALLDSPHSRRLEELGIEHNFFGDEEGEDEVIEEMEERFGEGLSFGE